MRFVPDVVGQFNALSTRPDPLGFHIGDGPDPSQCRHHQALIRTEAADGTPYFIVSRSGPPRDPCFAEDTDPSHVGNPIGNLYIVRMGSRDKHGERLRSNRLQRDLATRFTPPEPEDRVVRSIKFDGTAEWPHYDHPGGMQQVGSIIRPSAWSFRSHLSRPPARRKCGGGSRVLAVLVQFPGRNRPRESANQERIQTEGDSRMAVPVCRMPAPVWLL